MKKLLVIVMLLILIGCTKDPITMKDDLFEIPNFEYDMCTDDCETDFRVFETYFEGYWNHLNDLQDQLAPNRNKESLSFVSGEYYSRDDLVHDDPISNNMAVDLEYPYERFLYHFELTQAISQACSVGETECTFWYGERNYNLTEVSFGFQDTGGYLSAHIDLTNSSVSFDEFFWFEFLDDGSFDFEVQTYYNSDYFFIENMTGGIYRMYQYVYDHNIEIHYVNLNTLETFYYYLNGEDLYFYYLEGHSGFLYFYFPGLNSISVAKFTDMEYIAAAGCWNNSYSVEMNFYFMDGWDQIQYLGLLPVNLYNNGDDVFTDYTVRLTSTMPGYPSLIASILLEEAVFPTYEFPDSFNGGIPYSELYQQYEDFQNLEDAVEITGITSAQIQDFKETVLSHIRFS